MYAVSLDDCLNWFLLTHTARTEQKDLLDSHLQRIPWNSYARTLVHLFAMLVIGTWFHQLNGSPRLKRFLVARLGVAYHGFLLLCRMKCLFIT